MKIVRFEDIEAWKLARELTKKVYRLTKKTRFAKDYGLKRKIQGAAWSSMHNIAEAFDSETNGEFMRFSRYAKQSCTEVQSELYVALDEEYIAPSEFEDVYDQDGRIPPRQECPWLYQLSEEIRRAKDLNNREPLNREPNNLCSYIYSTQLKVLSMAFFHSR